MICGFIASEISPTSSPQTVGEPEHPLENPRGDALAFDAGITAGNQPLPNSLIVG
jgi:hypothetical protein